MIFSTLFKFIKQFEEALNGPSIPALVEQGSGASLDSVDANPQEMPIHRVHQLLKSTLPLKCRILQVQISQNTQSLIFSFNIFLITELCFYILDWWRRRRRVQSFFSTNISACTVQEDEEDVHPAAEEKPCPWAGWRLGLLHWWESYCWIVKITVEIIQLCCWTRHHPVTVLTLEYRLLKPTTAGYNCSHVSTLWSPLKNKKYI